MFLEHSPNYIEPISLKLPVTRTILFELHTTPTINTYQSYIFDGRLRFSEVVIV
jgi:hypothetical protein